MNIVEDDEAAAGSTRAARAQSNAMSDRSCNKEGTVIRPERISGRPASVGRVADTVNRLSSGPESLVWGSGEQIWHR
jgi:hypothetical protein